MPVTSDKTGLYDMRLPVVYPEGSLTLPDGTSLMTQASKKVSNVFEAVRTIIFILGGFGLVGVAFAAIFGKVNWKWFAALAVGLAILAAANAVVQYAAGSKAGTGVTDTFGV